MLFSMRFHPESASTVSGPVDALYFFSLLVSIFFSILIAVLVFLAWLVGAIKQPGYTPLMIAIAGSTSALLLGLGVVGSYVWRTYENSKGRPLELVATHEYFEP